MTDPSSPALDPRGLLELMRSDMAGERPLYQPTAFWRDASERISEDLLREGFDSVRALDSARSFFVPSYGSPGNALSPDEVQQIEQAVLAFAEAGSKQHAMVMDMVSGRAWAMADYRVFLAGDRVDVDPPLREVSESTVGNPPDQLHVDGRRYSRSILNYLHGLVFLKQVLGAVDVQSVLEVGGGYGTLGEILHKTGRPYAYVDVDIPPTAAVATFYLSHIEGLEIIDYSVTRTDPELRVPPPGSQMVICPWQLPRLRGAVDLLWNYISFQEMEPEVVRFYIAEAARLGARYVLSRNLREGKAVRKDEESLGVIEPVTSADYDEFLAGHQYELLATNVSPFGHRTVDGFHSELRLYARR